MFPLRATMSSYPEVMLTSDPPGAQIRLFPLDPVTGEPVDAKVVRTRGTTPLSARVPPGDYLVVAKLDDGRFHEVYRHVPVDPQRTSEHYFHKNWAADNRGRIIVPVVSIPRFDVDRQMVAFSDEREFSMDPHEVTVVEFRKPFNGEFPGHLRPAIVRDDHPMTTTSYDRAVMYAELVGKRLPSAKEFEFAATNGRTTRFPWGNGQRTISSSLAPVGTVEFDQSSGETPVYGLCSNGGEFTSTPFRANYSSYKNVVAKIPLSIQALSVDEVTVAGKPLDGKASVEPIGLPRQFIAPDVGFRCVRSKTPRW